MYMPLATHYLLLGGGVWGDSSNHSGHLSVMTIAGGAEESAGDIVHMKRPTGHTGNHVCLLLGVYNGIHVCEWLCACVFQAECNLMWMLLCEGGARPSYEGGWGPD